MQDLKELEMIGNEAVNQLRINDLKNGLPFMINSDDLPTTECYLEYPDGHISLAKLSSSRRDFDIIRNLSPKEIAAIRKKYNFFELASS